MRASIQRGLKHKNREEMTSLSPLHPNALILFLDNDVIPLGYCDVMNAPNALTHAHVSEPAVPNYY